MAKVTLHGLEKQYNGRTVLTKIDVSVTTGEIFAYIGPNGAGKTTTIRILLGIIKPTRGVAQIHDENGVQLAREKVGFVLEDEVPFENYTPEEYLRFYADIYNIKDKASIIERLLNTIGLAKRSREKIAKFSKGMKRKLCVAKALIAEPQVLFLDEPFEGIEIEARREIKDILTAMSKSSIIFLTSHNLYEIEPLCSTFGIIIEGAFLGKWSREALRGKSLEQFYFEVKERHGHERVD